MADTYKARTKMNEVLAELDDEEATAAFAVISDALYTERSRADSAERTVEAYRRAIADLMASRA